MGLQVSQAFTSSTWDGDGEGNSLGQSPTGPPILKRWILNWMDPKMLTQPHPPCLSSMNPPLQLALLRVLQRSKMNILHTLEE